MTKFSPLFFLLFTCFLAPHLNADVAYSNFGPDDSHSTFNTGFGNVSSIVGDSTNYHLARGFTSEATGSLSSIELPMSILPNLSNSAPGIATIALWSHEPGTVAGRPDQILWSADSELIENFGLQFQIFEINAVNDAPILSAGEVYWVVASSQDGSTPFLWAQNDDVNRVGKFGFSHTETIEWMGEANTSEMAFRVNVGNSVPEPTCSYLTCLSAMFLLRRKRASIKEE
jgi:hypothetical protein